MYCFLLLLLGANVTPGFLKSLIVNSFLALTEEDITITLRKITFSSDY
ncbi:hypothetical protein SAMN04487995_2060 [Dyadobacter koreensis]|uniref:Uncharacterized protein n=1 Tax=Dyadobacter koreensis TaxID=408657 RepID=A0A1H6T799_9BACT|nr:hypothetical protein SAMN04487995_2060 [Dyadobacter koreensis]